MEAGMEVEAGIQEVEMEVEVSLLTSAWVMEVEVISEMVQVIRKPLSWTQAENRFPRSQEWDSNSYGCCNSHYDSWRCVGVSSTSFLS